MALRSGVLISLNASARCGTSGSLSAAFFEILSAPAWTERISADFRRRSVRSLKIDELSFVVPILFQGIVRSRAFTLIALNGSQVTLTMNRFHAENVSPGGNYAADGVVFLTGGNAPVVNARVSQLTVLNPHMVGEVNNGDSIEIQHRGTTNGVLNIDMTRLDLRDPASANIKILEAGNPTNGVYNLSISDSVLSNANPAGSLDGQIRLSGASNGTKAFTLAVRNTKFSGRRDADCGGHGDASGRQDARDRRDRSRRRAARQPRPQSLREECRTRRIGVECQRRDRSDPSRRGRELLGKRTARRRDQRQRHVYAADAFDIRSRALTFHRTLSAPCSSPASWRTC